jgi:hypothetical protein
VSEFRVRPTCIGLVSNVPNTSFSITPSTLLPLKIANPDTVGKNSRYVCTARFRSASSYARCTVSGVGYPPTNS